MDIGQAVRNCFSNYANFSGRAQRSEYWYFFLLLVVAYIVTSVLDSAIFGSVPVLHLIATLALLVPSLSVGARRLHDTDKSGWWLLIGLVPIVGAIVLIVFFCQPGTAGANRFGADPLRTSRSDAHLARA